jgi:hypothetical protein
LGLRLDLLRERVRLALCTALSGYRSRRGSISMRQVRHMLFGTDECDPRLCVAARQIVLALLGPLIEGGLARVEGGSRKRVTFTDVPAAMAALKCNTAQKT